MASADSNLETPNYGNPRTDSVDAPRYALTSTVLNVALLLFLSIIVWT